MWYITALLVGLAGSLHCAGMCGPIVIALPSGVVGGIHLWNTRILYNLGRILTYGILGAMIGIIGQGLFLGGLQRWVSILSGIVLIISVLLPLRLTDRLNAAGFLNHINKRVRQQLATVLGNKRNRRYLLIGLLNGFLPCGLVYVALAGALNTGQAYLAALFMIIFGLGTFPLMLAVSLLGNFIGISVWRKFSRIIPVFVLLLGVLFILRGMNLGIKYISPAIHQKAGTEQVDTCH